MSGVFASSIRMKPNSKLHYIECGSGPPLLLLHGLFDSLETWTRLIPYLSDQFKVYALDLPGFGLSPLPEDWEESLSGMVMAVLQFLKDKGINRISLVGSSMGGGVSLMLAGQDPGRINKVALLNPYGLPDPPFAARNASRPILGRVLPYLIHKHALQKCAKSIFSRSLYDQSLLTEALINRLVQPFSSLQQRKNLFRFLRKISMNQIKSIDALLPDLQQSILILWGENDRWLSERHGQYLQERLPRSTLIRLSQCGHLPQMDQPEVVAKTLIPFLFGQNPE